jgi:glycopeptide antibiotics resistance protein
MIRLTKTLFIIYLLSLFWILLLKLGVRFSYMETRSINFIPFREAVLYNSKGDLAEVMLNVVIFIPLGIYAGLLFRQWNFGKKLLLFFGISLMFEVLQFILRIGAFDITDLLTNTFGGIIGLLLFYAIEKLFNNQVKTQRFINIVASVTTAVMLSLLLLLKLNLLPVRYQ